MECLIGFAQEPAPVASGGVALPNGGTCSSERRFGRIVTLRAREVKKYLYTGSTLLCAKYPMARERAHYIFAELSEDLARTVANSFNRVLCPLCLQAYSDDAIDLEEPELTEEHIIPESLPCTKRLSEISKCGICSGRSWQQARCRCGMCCPELCEKLRRRSVTGFGWGGTRCFYLQPMATAPRN